jgi:heterodisulfide reductase subunit D
MESAVEPKNTETSESTGQSQVEEKASAKQKVKKIPDLKNKKPPHLDDIYACLQCGFCKAVCPIYRETGWESLTPRGKVYILKQLIDKNSFLDKILGKRITNFLTGKGKIQLDELMRNIYRCTLCSRCETICHVEINFHEAWEEIRKWLVDNGIEPPENTIDMYKSIANSECHNPFMEPLAKRDEWYRDDYDLPDRAEVVYFPGCMTSFYEYQLLLNTMKVFTKAELDFTTLGKDETCCGAINVMTGQVDNFKDIAKANIDQIIKRGAKRVVTGCPGCYRGLKKYKKYVNYDFEIIHTTELVVELIDSGKLEFKKEFKAKNLPIVYHDPCELGRISYLEGKDLFDYPRRILNSIPGIDEVLEFPYNRMDSYCCGGGGGLKAVDYDLTTDITTRKIDEAIELGANTIVSSCPNCKAQIGIGVEMKKEEYKARGEKFKMNVMDVLDVVAKVV